MNIEALLFVIIINEISSENARFLSLYNQSNPFQPNRSNVFGFNPNFSSLDDDYFHSVQMNNQPAFVEKTSEDVDRSATLLDFCKNILMFINLFQDELPLRKIEKPKRLDLLNVLAETKERHLNISTSAPDGFLHDINESFMRSTVVSRNASQFPAPYFGTHEKNSRCFSKFHFPLMHEGASRIKFLFLLNFPTDRTKMLRERNASTVTTSSPVLFKETVIPESTKGAFGNSLKEANYSVDGFLNRNSTREASGDGNVWVWNVKNLFNMTESNANYLLANGRRE